MRLNDLSQLSDGVKLPVTLAFLVLSAGFCGYLWTGAPVPRPPFFFGLVAVVLGVLLVTTLRLSRPTAADALFIGSVGTFAAVVLRLSAFVTVISSGRDHARWVGRVQQNLEAGTVVGSDMYASAPFYLLELGIGRLLMGVGPYEGRFVTILVAGGLPAVVGLLATRFTESRKVGLIALLVAVPQFLFLRTSALLEAESMAIIWLVLVLLLLLVYLRDGDQRVLWLLVGLTASSVLLHFLYAVVIFGTLAGTLVLLYLVERVDDSYRPLRSVNLRPLIVGNVVVGAFIPIWILTSTYAGPAIDTLESFFGPPNMAAEETPSSTSTPTPEPEGSTPGATETPGVTENPEATPTQTAAEPTASAPPSGESGSGGGLVDPVLGVFDFIIPEAGTVGESVGVAGWQSVLDVLGALGPFLALIAVATLGGFVVLFRRREQDIVLLAATTTVVAGTLIAVAANLEFNLGYRLYYFVAALLCVFAALGIGWTGDRSSTGRRMLVGAVVLLFVGYAFVGPMSPLGNNVDPRFGGEQWRMTEQERLQLIAFDETLGGGQEIIHEIPQVGEDLRITSSNRYLHVTREECTTNNVVGDSGGIHICL
jgi:hypothetical protein